MKFVPIFIIQNYIGITSPIDQFVERRTIIKEVQGSIIGWITQRGVGPFLTSAILGFTNSLNSGTRLLGIFGERETDAISLGNPQWKHRTS